MSQEQIPESKNIVICCDATGNQYRDSNSNVISSTVFLSGMASRLPIIIQASEQSVLRMLDDGRESMDSIERVGLTALAKARKIFNWKLIGNGNLISPTLTEAVSVILPPL